MNLVVGPREHDSIELPILQAPPEDRSQLDSDICLGKPDRKAVLDSIDFGVVLCSFVCLVVGICIITPRLSLSWRLGYFNQLILIGFILSIMNLLLKKLTPTLLLSIEARWGTSTLQNYDAILRNSVFSSHTAFLWRLTILIFILLPLGLSVAYKRFTGGRSSAIITNKFAGRYGLAAPPLGDYAATQNSIYYAINANEAFSLVSSTDTTASTKIPGAFGYNTLVLNSGATALLDMPLPDYTSSIQNDLSGSDYWTISASVNATVARYNESTSMYVSSNFWEDTKNDSYGNGFGGMSMMYNWNGPAPVAIGWLPGLPTLNDGSYVFTGDFPYLANKYQWFAMSETVSDPKEEDWFNPFRERAMMFNIRREQCAGTWHINRTAIVLLGGSCTGVLTNQPPFTMTSFDQENTNRAYNTTPFPLDAMPVMVHALSSYFEARSGSLWRLPAYTTSIATAFWSHYLYMFPGNSQQGLWDSELNYPPKNEYIISTVSAMRADWLLYALLAVQPVLALMILICSTVIYTTPIGKGFGIVAILSGIQRNSPNLLSGAAFSGELKRPVKLTISVYNEGSTEDRDQKSIAGGIRYEINGISSNTKPLKRKAIYM